MAEVFADIFGEEGGVFDLVEFEVHATRDGGDTGLGESENLIASLEGLDFLLDDGLGFLDILGFAAQDVIFK